MTTSTTDSAPGSAQRGSSSGTTPDTVEQMARS